MPPLAGLGILAGRFPTKIPLLTELRSAGKTGDGGKGWARTAGARGREQTPGAGALRAMPLFFAEL